MSNPELGTAVELLSGGFWVPSVNFLSVIPGGLYAWCSVFKKQPAFVHLPWFRPQSGAVGLCSSRSNELFWIAPLINSCSFCMHLSDSFSCQAQGFWPKILLIQQTKILMTSWLEVELSEIQNGIKTGTIVTFIQQECKAHSVLSCIFCCISSDLYNLVLPSCSRGSVGSFGVPVLLKNSFSFAEPPELWEVREA